MNSTSSTAYPVLVRDRFLCRLPEFLFLVYFERTGKPIQHIVESRTRYRASRYWQALLLGLLAVALAIRLLSEGGSTISLLAGLVALASVLFFGLFSCIRWANRFNEDQFDRLNKFKGFVTDVCQWTGTDIHGLCRIGHEVYFWAQAIRWLEVLASQEGSEYADSLRFLESCAVTPYAESEGILDQLRATRPATSGMIIEM